MMSRKSDLEGALDLAEAGERVARIVAGGKRHAVDLEEVPPVGQELVVEAPARRVGLLAARSRPRRSCG